ncbi:MAG: DUF58 domain-containing protein [Cryobacterium sp.]|nr:DUF58 domain-containing protein [Cryobacterium sp.]MBX3103437.1 DUF58 domain-containing protein [Cryobacterium sp.]
MSKTRTSSAATLEGLTNVRSRLVGNRTGFLADSIVTIVKFSGQIRGIARNVVSRVSAVITPLGWVMLVIVPLCFIAGYVLGWLELVAFAWCGVVLMLVAVLYLVSRSPFRISLRLEHSRVIVGQDAVATVEIENPTQHRILGSVVDLSLGDEAASYWLPSLPASGSNFNEFELPTSRRGLITVGPVKTVRADPLGIVRREVIWTKSELLYVHPRTIGIPSTTTGFVRDLEGNPTRQITNSDISFHALREYVPGDERRNIHWKSTARTGIHMVRQFEVTRRSHLVVALSLSSSDYETAEEFELAVSVAGSLGVRAIRDARTVSVVVGERTPDFAKRKVFAVNRLSTITPNRLLDDLSLVEISESALNVRDIATVVADQVSGVSVAFLVCGSKTSASDLRSAQASFPVDVDVVAITCSPSDVPGLKSVPGLSVLTIGFLEELRKAMSKEAVA